MTRSARWGAVALVVLVVVAVPVVIRALPPPQSPLSARAVLAKVAAAEGRPWSGYVETRGTLELPVADGFADVGGLLADRTRMRAWWRGPDEWRVDRLLVSG